jgi:hypothetical protein
MPAFAGFDSYGYPGDETMDWFKANTNLVWCGYYLAPSSSHNNPSWMGKQAALAAAGWGIAPVYVGQQVIPPGSMNPTIATGQADGAQAAGYMASEGFPAGSYVYLDLENGPPLTSAQQDYVTAWSARVLSGGYKPGVYCSHLLADAVAALQTGCRIWTFRISATPPPMANPYPELDPGTVFAGATIWQHVQNCSIPVSAAGLKVDLNSASLADPSAPDAAG